jgi:hypothetical protein
MKNQANIAEFLYDFSVDGGALSTIVLSNKNGRNPIPVGAIIKDVTAHVVAACTTGAGGTLSWGYTGGVTAYKTATACGSLTLNAVFQGITSPIYVSDASTGAFVVDIATGALTAGKVVFVVHYDQPAIEV